MAAQSTEKQRREPETLKRHREMYEERQKYFRLTHGETEREITDRANNPRVYKENPELNTEETPSLAPARPEQE